MSTNRLAGLPTPVIRTIAFGMDYKSYHRLLMTCKSTHEALKDDPNRDIRRPWFVFSNQHLLPVVCQWREQFQGKSNEQAVAALGLDASVGTNSFAIVRRNRFRCVPYRYRFVAKVILRDSSSSSYDDPIWELRINMSKYVVAAYDRVQDWEQLLHTRERARGIRSEIVKHMAASNGYARSVGCAIENPLAVIQD